MVHQLEMQTSGEVGTGHVRKLSSKACCFQYFFQSLRPSIAGTLETTILAVIFTRVASFRIANLRAEFVLLQKSTLLHSFPAIYFILFCLDALRLPDLATLSLHTFLVMLNPSRCLFLIVEMCTRPRV